MVNSTFSGGWDTSVRNKILEYDISRQEWRQNITMSYAAQGIGLSVVNFADFEPWCQKRSLKKPIFPVAGKKGDDGSQPSDN